MIRKCNFIRGKDNIIYIPPPTSWLGGWTRQRWLERHFKKPSMLLIVSKSSCEDLSIKNKIEVLICKNANCLEKTADKKDNLNN